MAPHIPHRPSVRSAVREIVAILLCTLALVAPAYASDGVVGVVDVLAYADDASVLVDDASIGAAGQPQFIVNSRDFLREAQAKVLGPCIRNDHSLCRDRTVDLMVRMRAQGITVAAWALFTPVRNNMYFYLVAPSLRLANAILKSRGGCSDWQALASASGTSLPALLKDAANEVGGGTTRPEFAELRNLRDFLRRSCPGAIASADGDD